MTTQQPIEKVVGRIPAAATHWKCQRSTAKEGGGEKWATLFAYSADDADAKVSTWPIESLSLDAIREGWGAGGYKLMYFGDNGKGGLIRICNSTSFQLSEMKEARSAAPAPAPVAHAAPAPTPAGEALTMIQVASMLAKDQIAMIQLLSSQANQQQAAMAAQQVAFLQEHSRISHQQMSQHYGAMLRAAKSSEAPILAAVQQLGQRLSAIEDYEDDPSTELATTTPKPEDVPLGGMVTTDGRLSMPHLVQALGPRALDILESLVSKAKSENTTTTKAAAE